MKVSIGIGGAASGRKRDFDEQVDYVVEAEKLGVDSVWSAEAWGHDALTGTSYTDEGGTTYHPECFRKMTRGF
jgi:alkanesulfonate monooxygenase SsuD/methylene tetrahydromethanopterin reductase-like flavin-dependent oxidoreductase (luciferase family)